MTDSKKTKSSPDSQRDVTNVPKSTSTTATSKSDPAPKAPPATAPAPIRKAKPRYVRLRNMLSQVLTCSVVNDGGRAEELKLAARSTSGPVREDRLTDHTKTLIAKGHLRVGG